MRIAIRADSSSTIGTGHVMRCLTLSEELLANGHTVAFYTSEIEVPWLRQLISELEIEMHYVEESSLSIEQFSSFNPDWIVVDSYVIPSSEISNLCSSVRTLAIVDLDSRGISADLFLDQNFNSENAVWPENVTNKLLAGVKYSLIRNKILSSRRPRPWKFKQHTPNILCVMGGSDPSGTIIPIAEALSKVTMEFTATIVCTPQWQTEVEKRLSHDSRVTIVEPTNEIGHLYSQADLVVSAAGSSAWEICTLGIPSLLIAVADNQQLPLTQTREAKLALTLDRLSTEKDKFVQEIKESLELLIQDEILREELSSNSLKHFDGEGKKRVVQALESHL